MDDVKLIIDGVERDYKWNTSFLEISKEYAKKFKDEIILVKLNGNLRELNAKVTKSGNLEFITTQDVNGLRTYTRGMVMVLMKAIYQVVGQEKISKVSIEHSMGPGYYGEIEMDEEFSDDMLQQIELRMHEFVEKDILFEKYSIHTSDAIEKFHNYKMYAKEQLFRYRRVSKTNIYRLGEFEDYFFGYMPPSTGMLQYFKLIRYDNGFILQLPTTQDTKVVPKFQPREKLFKKLREVSKWSKGMEITSVGELNNVISKSEMSDLILVQEAFQEKKIGEIAGQIASCKNQKFVMIAGPSSSGKTTFSHRLSIQLRTFGLKPHPIGVDDYFVNRENTPLNEDGSYNFECIEAIDVEQFNKDMKDLLDGKRVELPSFNFKTGKREYKGNFKQLGTDDILVIEGIHGLNDKLSYALPDKSKFKIYISALTTLNIDEHNQIPTSDGRLIRRMVRDARTRGASASKTIAMWKSVRDGEEKYIFPFQESADVMFNSAMIYELAILKQFAEPILFSIEPSDLAYTEAKRLLKFLDYFVGVSSEDVPKNSILREFVGNSHFNV
ncbi:MAG: nucleoside kinase [Velocimicrobium sp.]